MILIISNKWDISVDFVIQLLQDAKHPYLRLNTEDLNSSLATITFPNFQIFFSRKKKTYDLARDIGAIWYRRPGKIFDGMNKDDRPSEATQRFVNDQWYSWIEAIQVVPDITWVNRPQANDAMENKIRQLFLAKVIGFTIPETIVSNDPIYIRKQIADHGDVMVAKALYSPLIEESDQDYFIFTTKICQNDIQRDDQIKITPSIFQKILLPKIDYRVTVVGDIVLAARIEADTNCTVELDWRTQKNGLRFVRTTLPEAIENLCRNYVKESGLVFGAIDLVKYEDQFIFLEINPNGEWGWLQKPNGLPIATAIVEFLIANDGK